MPVPVAAAAATPFLQSAGGAALISGGSAALQSIAQAIFASKDTKRIKRFLDFLRSQLGTDVISPEQQNAIFGNIDKSLAPSRNRRAQSVSNRLGLDSGVAQAELFRGNESDRFRARSDLAFRNEELKARRDLQFSSTISAGELGIV